MPIWTDNPVRDAERYFAEKEEELEALPECDMCGHPIQSIYLYEVFGQCICEDCMNSCRLDVSEYMEDCYE